MKYYATINEQTFEIAVDTPGRITVDGTELAADMQAVGGRQLYSLLLDNVSHEVLLDPDAEQRNVYRVMVGGRRYIVKVQDERSRRLALADRTVRASGAEAAVKAPISGLVVKTAVAPGQTVVEGETLIILEAMKMENELRSQRSGVVHEVRVARGDQVASGQVLMTIR